jgi:hypothetical protein
MMEKFENDINFWNFKILDANKALSFKIIFFSICEENPKSLMNMKNLKCSLKIRTFAPRKI